MSRRSTRSSHVIDILLARRCDGGQVQASPVLRVFMGVEQLPAFFFLLRISVVHSFFPEFMGNVMKTNSSARFNVTCW